MKNLFLILCLLNLISCNNQTGNKSNNLSQLINSKLNVEMKVRHINETDGLYFEIETNLPLNFQAMMTITDKRGEIQGQSKFLVSKGIIKSEKFTIHGNPYPPGEYKLEISSAYPHLQEDVKVKEIIGKTGENLIGKNIEREMDNIFKKQYSFLRVNYKFKLIK